MRKILFVSFRWNDERLQKHSSDKMMAFGFERAGWDVSYYDYREQAKLCNRNLNNKRIVELIVKTNPEIVFFNKCEKIDPSIVRIAKSIGWKGRAVYWHMDIRRSLVRSVITKAVLIQG